MPVAFDDVGASPEPQLLLSRGRDVTGESTAPPNHGTYADIEFEAGSCGNVLSPDALESVAHTRNRPNSKLEWISWQTTSF
jgi:hypothetical protein